MENRNRPVHPYFEHFGHLCRLSGSNRSKSDFFVQIFQKTHFFPGQSRFFKILSFSSKVAQIGVQKHFFCVLKKPKGGTLENFQILKKGLYTPILSTLRSDQDEKVFAASNLKGAPFIYRETGPPLFDQIQVDYWQLPLIYRQKETQVPPPID